MLVAALVVGVGCGRSRRALPEGAGGNAGESGAANGAGMAGAALGPSANDELEACLGFVRTLCNKLFFECNGAPDDEHPCPPSVDSSCPNRYFTPGSSTSIADLSSCADEWRAAACSDIQTGTRPDCLPRGERPLGDACVFGAECSSGFCAASTNPDGSPGCGTCERIAALGEDCASEPVRCADGLECHDTCVPSPPFGLPRDSACERFSQCESGLYCLRYDGEDTPKCRPASFVGSVCPIDPPYCEGNCDADGICQKAPDEGLPCALGATDAHACRDGLRCDLDDPRGPTCAAPLSLGEPCKPLNADFSSGGCEAPALCHCDDVACEAGTCVLRRDAGEACDGEHDVCLGGTSCDAGVCAPSGPQDRFSLACEG